MNYNTFKDFFDFLVPQNLKDNESISKLLNLYFSEISNIDTENPFELLNTKYLDSKLPDISGTIKNELLKIHLDEVFKVIDNLKDDEEVMQKFKNMYELLGISMEDFTLVSNISDIIDSEYISASKSFKSRKGTRTGFFYIYDLINRANIQAIDNEPLFRLLEGSSDNPYEPYVYRIESSLYPDVYDKTIVPLTHPAGFEYIFSRLLYLILEDNYNILDKTELTKLIIGCYIDTPNGRVLETVDALDGRFGEFKSINIITNEDQEEKVIIDFYPIDQFAIDANYNGFRIIKEFNGNMSRYTRQDIVYPPDYPTETWYLDISDVQLIDENHGILESFKVNRCYKGSSINVIDEISFKEYTIIDKEVLRIKFKIFGDKPDTWYTSLIPLTSKVISSDKKFFNKEYFTRKEILDYAIDYNGRLIEEKSLGCQFSYTIEKSYELAVSEDIINETKIFEIEDDFSRKSIFGDTAHYIGQYIMDYNTEPLFQIPIIGHLDSNNEYYEIGLKSKIKTNKDFFDNTLDIIDYDNEYNVAYEKLSFNINYNLNTNTNLYTIVKEPYEVGGFFKDEEILIRENSDFNFINSYNIYTDYISYKGTEQKEDYFEFVIINNDNIEYQREFSEDINISIYRNGELVPNNNLDKLK